jgi:hypothetical protein
MLTLEDSVRFASRKSNISMAHLTLSVLLLMPLAGCTGEGAGGPVISSLSTPTDASAGSDSDSDQTSNSDNSEPAHHDGDEDPIIAMTPTLTGVTAHLTWDPPPDFNVAGYYIYHGKRLSEEPRSEETNSEESNSEETSSCSRGEKHAVDASPATITGLEPNTPYFFAIRAFNENESESLCSNEIMVVTPSAQS